MKIEQPNLEEIKRRFNIADEYIHKEKTSDSPEKNSRFIVYLDSLKRSKKVSDTNYDIFKLAFHPNPEMIEEIPEPSEEDLIVMAGIKKKIEMMLEKETTEPEPKRKRKPRRTKKQMEAAREKEAKEAKEAKDN